MKKTYNHIAIGSFVAIALALSPFAALAKSPLEKVGVGANASLNANVSVGTGSSSSAVNAQSEGNAYGHLVAPGYIKNNGTTTASSTIALPPGIQKKLTDRNGTSTKPVIQNLSPVINSIAGSTTIAAGQSGTWTISAYDPEGGALSYRASFGDNIWSNWFWFWQPYVTSSVFTHTYASAGAYTAKFTVKDQGGAKVSVTLPIVVTASTTATTTASI